MNKIVVYSILTRPDTGAIIQYNRMNKETSSFTLAFLKYIVDNYENLHDNILFIDEHLHSLKTLDSKINFEDLNNIFVIDNNLIKVGKNYILRSSHAFYKDLYSKLLEKYITDVDSFDKVLETNRLKVNSSKYIVCMTSCRLKDDFNGLTITKVLRETIKSLYEHTDNVELYVVDDGSTKEHIGELKKLEKEYGFTLVLKEHNGGISKAKNTCLKIFKESDAEFCFLIDDDILFKKNGWAEQYIKSMQECNLHQICLNDFKYIGMSPSVINISGNIFNYATHTTGCFIAISKECLNQLGGFHVFKGKWGGEHHNYYKRCQLANLTLNNYFLDISDSKEYIDLNTQCSTYTLEEKKEMLNLNMNEGDCYAIYQDIIE